MYAMEQERQSDSSTGVAAAPTLFDKLNTTAKGRNTSIEKENNKASRLTKHYSNRSKGLS